MTILCRELFISTVNDPANAFSRLCEAKENEVITVLHVHAEQIDENTASAVCDLLEHEDRQWESISFISRGERLFHEKPLGKAVLSTHQLFRSTFRNALALKHFRITTTICHEVASLIAHGICDNTTIQSLDFRRSIFEKRSVAKLCEGLCSNKELTKVDLSSCNLEDSDVAEIAAALQNHPSLSSLVLAFNNCGEKGGCQLSRLLQSPSCKVRELDLSFQHRDGFSKLECHSILNAIKGSTSLKSLNLTCNRLSDEDAEAIARIMTDNSKIQNLLLARNNFTDKGMKDFARHLPQMKGLKSLSLWGNKISEIGAEALLTGISMNTELHTLDLFNQFPKISDQIDFFGNFNRVGRRLIHQQPGDVPIAIWPLLFARANAVKLSTRSNGDCKDETSCRAEMIYHTLHSQVIDSFRHI